MRNELSDKERLSYFDDYEASFLPRELADDPTFLKKAATVANAASEYERRRVADAEAPDYAPYRSPARALITNYLLIAAKGPWREYLRGEYNEKTDAAARRSWFGDLSSRPVWSDCDPDDGDPRRIRRREATLEEGARRVARFGAGICVLCGTTSLPDRYVRVGASRRQARRGRCEKCDGKRDPYATAMRDVLEAATRLRQRRRAARRRH